MGIRIIPGIAHDLCDCVLVCVLPCRASLDHLVAGIANAVQSLRQCVFFDVRYPGGEFVRPVENCGNFSLVKGICRSKVVLRHLQILFGAFPAYRFCFAESAPVAAGKLAAALIRKSGLLGKLSACPFEQSVLHHAADADVADPRLEDGHPYLFDIVDTVEDLQSTERIQHHLRIAFGGDLHTLAMLVIDDVHRAVRDDDTVGGSEPVLHEAGEVHPLFHKNHRVDTGFLCLLKQLQNIGSVVLGTFLHLTVVPAEMFRRIDCRHSEQLSELELAKAVCVGSFLGVLAALVRDALAEPHGRRTVQPAVACRSGEERVFTHYPAPPLPS